MKIAVIGAGITGITTAYSLAKRGVEVVVYDENFYPAYYEDDDYAIRIHYSGLKAIKYQDTPLLHGEIDGSKDYASGIFKELYWKPKNDLATKRWKKMFEYGVIVSTKYIASKWGLSFIGKSNKNFIVSTVNLSKELFLL
jgi:choline dehydrogenase-like flavoprotein